MSEAEEQTTVENYGYSGGTIWALTSIVMVFIASYHSLKVYQDLATNDRNSVRHRRTKPTITKQYKAIAICTLASIILFTLSSLGSTFSYFSTNNARCDVYVTILVSTLQYAKTLMYTVFLIRLYTVYETSAYFFSSKCITFFMVLLQIIGLIVVIGCIAFITSSVSDYGDAEYPNYCGTPDGLFLVVGGMIIIQDIAVAIGFLCAFMLPLNKTLKLVDKKANQKIHKKIMYAGTKTTILTSTSLFSTVILVIISIITGIGVFGSLDPIINSLSMMFMTAYYKDQIYYRRYCCLCIFCCDKKGTAKQHEMLEETANNESSNKRAESTNVKSIDTMSQLRVAGGNIKASYNPEYNANGNSKEMVEVTPDPQGSNDNDDNKQEDVP